MGLREKFEITNYGLPIQLSFVYDGEEVGDLKAQIRLVNIEGREQEVIRVTVPLTAAQKTTLQGVLDTKLAAFEATNGWPLFVAP